MVATPFQFFPEMWRWDNYARLLADEAFLRSLGVTFAGAALFAALSLVVNALGAYAFARLEFAFKRTIWVIVLTTMFIPGIAITYPLTRISGTIITGSGSVTGLAGGDEGTGPFLDIPWLLIVGLVVLLPLLTAAIVGLSTRSRLPLVARLD